MNKSELIADISQRTKVPVLQAEQVINFAIEIISEQISMGEKVYIVGLGTFEARKRLSHNAVNPRTGERIKIEEYETPVFRAAVPLKRRVRNRDK